MQANGSAPLLPDDVSALPGPRRVDRVRKALRGQGISATSVRENLDGWIRLYRRDVQGALRVLVLELLERVDDPRVEALIDDALDDRADGVRLEALRLRLDRTPARTAELAGTALDDEAIEVRLLAAERLYDVDPDRAVDAMFEIARAEAHTWREGHTLDRVTEFLVEDVGDPRLAARLRAIRDEFDDPEDMIDWAIERLSGSDR